MCVHVCVCLCMCMYVCVCICMYAQACVSTYMCVYVSIYICTASHISEYTPSHFKCQNLQIKITVPSQMEFFKKHLLHWCMFPGQCPSPPPVLHAVFCFLNLPTIRENGHF